MTRIALVVLLAACSSKSAPPSTIDCKALADHLDDVLRKAIAELPEDKRAAAEARMDATRHDKFVADCQASSEARRGSYACMMKATTVRDIKACDD